VNDWFNMFAFTLLAHALLLRPQAGHATAAARAGTVRAVLEPTAKVSDGTFAFDVPSIVIGGGRIGSTLMDLGCEGAESTAEQSAPCILLSRAKYASCSGVQRCRGSKRGAAEAHAQRALHQHQRFISQHLSTTRMRR